MPIDWANYVDNDYINPRDREYCPGIWTTASVVSIGDYIVIWSQRGPYPSTVVTVTGIDNYNDSRGTFLTTLDLRCGERRHFYFLFDREIFLAWPREFNDSESDLLTGMFLLTPDEQRNAIQEYREHYKKYQKGDLT